ncbi:MAG: HNH endonuclease signature motif containing protein [Dehalococcoidales bacterium]|nr:HNH endonuclease signature motif containing protein [Dehalococcoidales bacterium]
MARAARKKYSLSEKGKASSLRYRKTKKCRAKSNKALKKWKGSEKGRLWRERYEANGSMRISRKRYDQTTKGKAAVARKGSKRRAQKKILATLTAKEWADIKKQYKYKCAYCGEKKPLTMDHIIPINKGGHHVKENIIPACLRCNAKKGDRPVLLQLLALTEVKCQ